jgi:hypothetical protein
VTHDTMLWPAQTIRTSSRQHSPWKNFSRHERIARQQSYFSRIIGGANRSTQIELCTLSENGSGKRDCS